MSLLLDTHFFIAMARGELDERFPDLRSGLATSRDIMHASVASLWEIAIKTRLSKLDVAVPPENLGNLFEAFGLAILDVTRHHAVASIEPEPATRDPFDRMLLAQCKVEGLKLVTVDKALTDHPLAWRRSR